MKCSWLENAIFYEIYPNSFKDKAGNEAAVRTITYIV